MGIKRRYFLNMIIIRLPIRNWNVDKDGVNSDDVLIIRLPIRNWNKSSQSPFQKTEQIIRLPIRNWNQKANKIIYFTLTQLLDYL